MYGQVAICPPLGYIARCQIGSAMVYSRIPPDALPELDSDPKSWCRPDLAGPGPTIVRNMMRWHPITLDPCAAISKRIDICGGWDNFGVFVVPETVAEKEAREFREAFPTIAASFGIGAKPAATALFPVGRVMMPRFKPGRHIDAPWGDFLNRHVQGDFGANGQHSATRLTPGETFALAYQSAARQSDHAVIAGVGLVTSRYPVGERTVDITTWPQGSITVMTIA